MFTVDCGETLVSNTSTPRPTEEKSGNVEEFIYDPSSLHLGKYFIRKLPRSFFSLSLSFENISCVFLIIYMNNFLE